MKLEGKTAIITGSSKGIGAEMAVEFAREGADVLVNYHTDEEGAQKTAAKIRQLGRRAVAVMANVSTYAGCEKLINTCLAEFGKIDILVNNAAVAYWRPLFEITEEIWDKTINTNLKGAFLCSQMAAKVMVPQGNGVILNISSIAADGYMDCFLPYCVSKGGMTLLTQSMATELAPYHIRVNALAPGSIDIKRNRDTDPKYPVNWESSIPLGRVGEVEEIAKPAVFLCSDDASYITGATLYACGGITAYVPIPKSEFARFSR